MHRRYAHRRHSHVPRLTRDLHERHRRAAATFSTAKSTKNQYQKNKEASATEVGGQLLPRLALFLYPFVPGQCTTCLDAAMAVQVTEVVCSSIGRAGVELSGSS